MGFGTRITFLFAAALLIATPLSAQTRTRPRAEVTPIVLPPDAGHARLALPVTLPEGLHTQSNKPRDPSVIPTELAIDAPSGVSVAEIVWPEAHDFKVEGLDPLAVFEREFYIGVQLSSVPAAGTKIPAHLRYQ